MTSYGAQGKLTPSADLTFDTLLETADDVENCDFDGPV